MTKAGSSLRFLLLCLSASWAFGERAGEGAGDRADAEVDIWTEVRLLRDMVVEQKVELRNVEARLRETETRADEQKSDLLLAKARLEELKGDHAATEERLRTSEKLGEDLRRDNVEQSAQLTGLGAKLGASERQVEELKADLESDAAELLSTQARVAVQAVELSSLMDRINTAERQLGLLLNESAKVAFYAGLTDTELVGPHDTPTVLTFSRVTTNVGTAYSPTSGFFTAPARGAYVFRFTICGSMLEGIAMGAQLFLNGKSIVYNSQTTSSHWNHFQYLSNSVVLELNVGDEVHMVLPEGAQLFDNPNNHSTFSGFLLFSV